MKLVTSEQMQRIDREAIDNRKIPSLELMEKAGKGIAGQIVKSVFHSQPRQKVSVFCGKGNNGGDGFVIARYLFQQGHDVNIYIPSTVDKLSEDARINYKKAIDLKIPVHEIKTASDFPQKLECDCIIDAVFGTGFTGTPRGLLAEMIEYINQQELLTVAVDMPSGLNADNGKHEGCVVQADYTFTLALPKYGLFVSPGRELSGERSIVPIGIPDEVVNSFDLRTDLLMMDKMAEMLPYRQPDGHKGTFGKVLAVAGSTGMTGAAVLAAKAALRSGCGMVKIACPQSCLPIIASSIIEATSVPMPDVKKRGVLALRGLGMLNELVKEHDSVIIGPGLGQHHETKELVRRFIQRCDKPMIIDADGLNVLAGQIDILQKIKAPVVLTPHPGEFARLTKEAVAENITDRITQASAFAKRNGVTVVLKGSPSVVCDPIGRSALNPTGNEGMATGGSGDVLSGIIGAMLGQGMSGFDSACLGVFIHGLAGNFAAEEVGSRSVIAGDLIDCLPDAYLSLLG